jgi:hypothetical protein
VKREKCFGSLKVRTFGIKTTATLDLTLATKRTIEERSKPVKEVNI